MIWIHLPLMRGCAKNIRLKPAARDPAITEGEQDSMTAMTGPVVLIRGGGEQASGAAWTLTTAGFRVVMTEIAQPLMVRWPVSFGTAASEGVWEVEGVRAVRVDPSTCPEVWSRREIPLVVDPDLACLRELKPLVVVDAVMAKRNIGTQKTMAPLTIGLGPGFTAGTDVHVVVETNRGHNLGRLIHIGSAEPNTGIPGDVAGYTFDRVVYSPVAGEFIPRQEIGTCVRTGDVIGEICCGGRTVPVFAAIDGVVRGLLRKGTWVQAQVKIGDIDPRARREYCYTISDKARSIGGAVLLAILSWQAQLRERF